MNACINYKMLEYDVIDIFEGIGGHNDLMQEAMNFNDAAIVSVKRNDSKIHFGYISKGDAINKMKNSI